MQLRLTSTVVFAPAFLLCLAASEPDSVTETNASGESNATLPRSKEDTIAEMLDRALEKEFNETEQSEGPYEISLGESTFSLLWLFISGSILKVGFPVSGFLAFFYLNDGLLGKFPRHAFDQQFKQLTDPGSFDNSVAGEQDNVFIMSNPKSKYPVLQLDLRLMSDLVVVIVSAACGGIAFACAGQPVETVAQFGVMFLLFALGLEFSTTKLCVVQVVAVVGDLLQIFLFTCLSGITAWLCGGSPSGGVFVGAFLSMSSTAVVRSISAPSWTGRHGHANPAGNFDVYN